MKVYYQTDNTLLWQDGDELRLQYEASVYLIDASPQEPCTYLWRDGSLHSVIHSAFSLQEILELAQNGGTITAITGCSYDLKRLCRLLAYAAEHPGNYPLDVPEGKLAVLDMKQQNAYSPETAVTLQSLGVRKLSREFSHSRKLSERVVQTSDGRVYLQIKKP